MKWNKAKDSKPSQGHRVLLKIEHEECPVVGYWGCGEWEVCTINMTVDCCGYCYGGSCARDFESIEVTHWAEIKNIPED